MAEITAAAVNALRQETGLPMMQVKKALQEAGGDREKAIEILRQQVGKVMLSRATNVTNEGRIFIKATEDGSRAAMVEVQCESAPVTGSDLFLELGNALVTQLLSGPGAASVDALLAQGVPGKSGQTLQQFLEEVVNKIREKFVIARVARVEGPVGTYVHHDGKTAVLFQGEGTAKQPQILRDVAMHIAALKPVVVLPEQLDPAQVKVERDRLAEEARKTGKPANIIDKIVDGKMGVFYREVGVLTEQLFAKDDTKTVKQVLAEGGLKAKAFTLWVLGN